MSAASPTRPSRRAASRKKLVVDSSDEDDTNTTRQQDSEDDFTPAPATSPRRTARRKTTETASTPRTGGRTRRTRAGESIEPSQIFSPPESNAPSEPPSPSKKAPPKRKSVRSSRKSRASLAPEVPQTPTEPLPTPKPSLSPDPSESLMESGDSTLLAPKPSPTPVPQQRHATPLADITNSTINEQTQILEDVTELAKPDPIAKVDTQTTVLEKPMDIVIRTRHTALPVVQESSEPKSRLVITNLVLMNFKSYAGRQIVGPFHASFSSVVGPNGSGKSNVIDSLLFVFGFRASKMRQGKISALIHNSAAFPDLEYCEVEVHFQEVIDIPGGGHNVIPDSTLVVSRRAFKNNQSKYYINGSTSDFTRVTTLLKDRGIDLDHKRFLILQGEVESIAQMKPKAANEHDDGLLEYLEDIIGTSKYKTPIEEAAAETETLNEVCVEKSGRVQHVEKEKNALEDKKDKALAYIRDENELAIKQAALYQISMAEARDTYEVNQEAVSKLQAQLDEELQRHAGSEDGIKRLEKQYKTSSKDFEQLERDSQALLKEMAKIDKDTVKFEEKKKFLTGKQKKLEKSLQTAAFGIAEQETLIKQGTDDVERCNEQIVELEDQITREEHELNGIRESLKGKTQGLSDEIATKQRSLEPWQERISQKQSAMAVAQSELDILRERENAGAVAIAEIETKISGFDESKVAKTEKLGNAKAEKATVEEELHAVQAEYDELIEKEPALRSKLSGARQKADEAQSSLSATQTQGNVLSGLMRLKESGRIEGFHGRLGNLGAIDQKYDVAISTACPSLDNLVVDTVEVGQACIDYLRKNNLGRANFILLDRLPQRDMSAIETSENVPRLFDLVKPKDKKFMPAFYSVLQNTLVANNLEQANRIAYGAKRWRVVTLDGQLIDKSGTMTGGGTRVAKGAMSSKLVADVSKEQVTKLEGDREKYEEMFAEFQKDVRELDERLRALKNKIPSFETQAQKLILEIESFDRNITDARKRIQELTVEQTTQKGDQKRILTLQKTISELEAEIERLRSETSNVEEEIKTLQDKIMEIGGVRLRSQKAKVDGLKDQVNTLSEEMSNAEVSRTKARKQKTKHEKAQTDSERDLAGTAKEMEKVADQMTVHVQNASGSSQQAEEAQESLEAKKEELQALKTELDQKQAELNETRGIEIEMRNKLEEKQKIGDEAARRLRSFEEKLSKLELHNIEDLMTTNAATMIPIYSPDELADMSKETLKREIAALESQTQSNRVDLSVLSDYRRRVAEHSSRLADLNSAIGTREASKRKLDELRRLRLEGFMQGFSEISMRLKEMYQMITMGGNAELELVDSLDPFAEGILFSVMPPKKSWKNISNLSGGEKTLSSLALVFALHQYKPTPLYVMDEIDAALDFRNVSIVASYIKERTKNAQFIVISLRNNMFELAARLVGVYKVNHMTKSVTVENKDYIVARS
ncbi:RecF/RecN/SMC protein [Eremomyces bilateralis CBS 781.70]|uniref:Structural maintenance of chromosomes protein n=1 Tax=Eremomyces bilateralis CBS 781.70 TaxID=1392243 RepID=A0A6G1FS37_9PEZI|nr:RecF/RecN/SMC protein [Eremomyces bilateralis CBS 781.70]KAF1808482.1 RecF/RecN/SMC protein [Eremomyces bilateralis CBS 781.70]